MTRVGHTGHLVSCFHVGRRSSRPSALAVGLIVGSLCGGALAAPNPAAAPASGVSPGASSAPVKPPPPQTHEIELSAGHVELDGPPGTLVLSQGVELRVHRYRLKAESLSLHRGPRGVYVEGDGELSFCACDSSPLTVGFGSATVAPPTDLVLSGATMRLCDVPIFYSPFFWIRSPSRVGLKIPRFAYRGSDGPWAGSGIHVPLSRRVEPSPEYVDFSLGGYVEGGWDVGAQLVTTNTVTSVRWDYLRHGLVLVDAWGHRRLGDESAANWRLDALRQARGLRGPVSFETATRRYDRLRIEASTIGGPWLSAVQAFADPPRAGRLSTLDGRGGGLRVAVGTAIGEVGHVGTHTFLRAESSGVDGDYVRILHAGDVGMDARPGPLVVGWKAHERWVAGGSLRGRPWGGLGGIETQMSLPLVRRWGEGANDPLYHWVEPSAGARALVEKEWLQLGDGRLSAGQAAHVGVRSVLGRAASSLATSLEMKAGVVSRRGETRRVVVARQLSSARFWALGGDLGLVGPKDWSSTARFRLGRTDQLTLDGRLEGRTRGEARLVQWLTEEGWEGPTETFQFDAPGWVIGSGLGVPIGRLVALRVDSAVDVSQARWLGSHFGVGYRHGCGCAAVVLDGGHRLGQGGWEVGLALELMPK